MDLKNSGNMDDMCVSCMFCVCQRETTLDQMAGTVPLATPTLLNYGTQWEQG